MIKVICLQGVIGQWGSSLRQSQDRPHISIHSSVHLPKLHPDSLCRLKMRRDL